MRGKIKFFNLVLNDSDYIFSIEILLSVTAIFFGFNHQNVYTNHLYEVNTGLTGLSKTAFNGFFMSIASSILYNMFIVIILMAAYDTFIFGRAFDSNKLLVFNSLKFSKLDIYITYYLVFIILTTIILFVFYFIAGFLIFLSFQLEIVITMFIYSIVFFMFCLSTGFFFITTTKNSIVSIILIPLLFYIAIPSILLKPVNTYYFYFLEPPLGFSAFGNNMNSIYGLILDIIASALLISLSVYFSYFRDLKVVR